MSLLSTGMPFPPYPKSNYQTLAYSAYRQVFNGADVDMNGHMTGEELAAYQNQLDDIRTFVAAPNLDAQREAARNLMVHFDKIANRALLPGEFTTMDFRPDDATIELSEIQKIARAADNNPNDISQSDWRRFLGKGPSLPYNPTPAPPVPSLPSSKPSKYDGFIQWLLAYVTQYNSRR